jgi:hypothetical protein
VRGPRLDPALEHVEVCVAEGTEPLLRTTSSQPPIDSRNGPAPTSGGSDSAIRLTRRSSRLTRKSVIRGLNALTISAPARPANLTVAGIDLAEEAARVRRLPVFAGGALAERSPAIRVRRTRRRPNRLGFAVPGEWRVSVTAYPGIRPGDVCETLLHELVHLHVGTEPGHRRWHGMVFKETLRRAMAEAYGLVGVAPANTLHGTYADALEALAARRAAAGAGVQLQLRLAC